MDISKAFPLGNFGLVLHSIMLLQILLALALSTEARIDSPLQRRDGYPNGVATFNNYAAQGNTNCGPMAGRSIFSETPSPDLHSIPNLDIQDI